MTNETIASRICRALLILPVAAAAFFATPAQADWLVTKEGARIETRGPWELRGRIIVFTLPNGTLSSIRESEIDLEASHDATEAANRPAEPAPEPEAEPKPSVLSITDADVGRGQVGSQGRQLLLDKLENAHRSGDVASAMALVSFQDTPAPYREFMQKELQWLMGREIRNLDLTPITSDAGLRQIHDGVTYEPNVDVSHRLEIEVEPDEVDERLTLKLFVGTRLGVYFIAAARPTGS